MLQTNTEDGHLNTAIIGAAIRQARIKKDLSLEVASGLAGIGRAHLSRIETGNCIPQIDTLMKIADALDMRLSHLIQQIEEAEKKE